MISTRRNQGRLHDRGEITNCPKAKDGRVTGRGEEGGRGQRGGQRRTRDRCHCACVFSSPPFYFRNVLMILLHS